jgi:hypothetical protein
VFSSLIPVVTRRYITFGDNGRGHVLSEGEIKVSDRITLRRVEHHVWFEDRWMVASLCDE